MNSIVRRLAAIAVFLLLTGFGPGTPIYNVTSSPIPANPGATMENLEKAVVRAGMTLGWKITPQGPGRAEGVLVLRTHTAVVDISYDAKAFSIAYKDSVNLSYRPENKTIHSNYNGWVQNLEKAIRAQVTVL